MAGYVTSCRGTVVTPDLHRGELHRPRTLLVVVEMHHLPALAKVAAEAIIPGRR